MPRILNIISFTGVDQLAVSLDYKILAQVTYVKEGEMSETGNHRKSKTSTDIYA
jgi:hypothetical protein